MADGPSLDCRIEDVRGYNTLEDLTQPNSLTSKGGGYSDDKGGCESYQLPGQPRPCCSQLKTCIALTKDFYLQAYCRLLYTLGF